MPEAERVEAGMATTKSYLLKNESMCLGARRASRARSGGRKRKCAVQMWKLSAGQSLVVEEELAGAISTSARNARAQRRCVNNAG
jgi:hypothetical protein